MYQAMWPRILTEAERSAILDDQLERFASDGWRVLHRTATTAQITRSKRISVGAALLWALCFLVGLLVYLLLHLSRRDPVGRLIVGQDGRVHGDWSDGEDYWLTLPGDWACRRCRYTNRVERLACVCCGRHR
jgi:hypothetical protein